MGEGRTEEGRDVMLTPDYFTGKEERLVELYQGLEDFIMRDIARRIIEAGELTATADRMILLLQMMGASKAAIQAEITRLTGLTETELEAILQEAVLASWKDDKGALNAMGIEVTPPLENEAVIEVMNAEFKKSLGELENLTRTTMSESQRDLIRLLDEAELRVTNGVQSYSAAVNQVLDEYAGKGLMVEYPSGAKRTVEAAVRCCVVTSMNQTAAQITNEYIREAGIEYVLTSAHIGARVKRPGQPDLAGHDLWQGRVFKIRGSEPGYPNLLEATGYDINPDTGQGTVVNPLGMHGYNCRHGHRLFSKDMNNPYRDKDGNLLDGDGNKIDSEANREKYDKTQKQRAMERAIRKTKRRLLMKQVEIDADPDNLDLKADYVKLHNRLTEQNKAYNDWCKENDMVPQYERNKVEGYGYKQEKAAKQYRQEVK